MCLRDPNHSEPPCNGTGTVSAGSGASRRVSFGVPWTTNEAQRRSSQWQPGSQDNQSMQNSSKLLYSLPPQNNGPT
ncbi:hypothetical protein XENTR_v10007015 [Xenopus tropicalis]|nr:hypothetical protein XENTR_v10007015 [Xenopus tropicalis]